MNNLTLKNTLEMKKKNLEELAIKFGNEMQPEVLKGIINIRFANNDFGYSEDKTERGVLVKTLITDAVQKDFIIELAKTYGIVSDFALNEYQNKIGNEKEEVINKLKLLVKKFEKFLGKYLTQTIDLPGVFYTEWETTEPKIYNEVYYGICYLEKVA